MAERRRHDEDTNSEVLGISRARGGRGDAARAGGPRRRDPTTEYGANAEPGETGEGYVEGADPPAEGGDIRPRGKKEHRPSPEQVKENLETDLPG